MPQAACKALAPRPMPSRHMSVSRSGAHGPMRGRQNGNHIRVILVAADAHVRCGSLTAADGAADRRRRSSHTLAAAAPCPCPKPSAAPPSTKHRRFLQAQSSHVSFTPSRAAAPPLAAKNTQSPQITPDGHVTRLPIHSGGPHIRAPPPVLPKTHKVRKLTFCYRAPDFHGLSGPIRQGAAPCPYTFPIHSGRLSYTPTIPIHLHSIHIDTTPAKTSAELWYACTSTSGGRH